MKRLQAKGLALVGITICIISFSEAAQIQVPGEYATIQAALDAANHGDEIIVGDDTYRGKGNRDLDFNGKAIILRSENGAESCIIDCEGNELENHRGVYFNDDEGPDTVLDGFTITGGYQVGAGESGNGGGINVYNCSPTIRNCIIYGNQANSGGALHLVSSDAYIANCTLKQNTANFGAGISATYGEPEMVNCTIFNNSAESEGGGVYLFGTQALVDQCRIMSNEVTDDSGSGGALLCKQSSDEITNCLIESNTGAGEGGVVLSEGTSLLKNCVIRNNDRIGVYLNFTDSNVIECLIEGNIDDDFGGSGITVRGGTSAIRKCTITGNRSARGAVNVYDGSVVSLVNMVIWDNDTDYALYIYTSDATATVSYSNIEGGQGGVYLEPGSVLNWGDGNIDIDPGGRGYWDDNGTPEDESDDTWVADGDEAPEPPDLEEYEYDTEGFIISKIIFKAGKTRDEQADSFRVFGFFGAEVADFTSAETVILSVGSYTSDPIDTAEFDQSGTSPIYKYKNPDGGITYLKLDFLKGTFKADGRNLNLMGTTAPVPVTLEFGDYYGYAEAEDEGDSDVINNRRNLPVQFLTGYDDYLSVTKVKCKEGDSSNVKSLVCQGGIALENNVDLTTTGMTIHWGTEPYVLEGTDFTPVSTAKYIGKIAPSGDDNSKATVAVDFNKCTFKIVLKNTDIPWQSSPVNFGLEMGDFYEQEILYFSTSTVTDPANVIEIDPATVTGSIDEKIYSHFLEHIYHSVNGGLWGELVWNRSFENWPNNLGHWSIDGNEIVQSSMDTDKRLTFGDPAWDNYEFTCQAMKTSGSEGFLIIFRSDGGNEFYWLNLGGWGNTVHTLEKSLSSGSRGSIVDTEVAGSIETGQWYDITIRCEGNRIRVWLDSEEIIDYTDTDNPHLTGMVGVGTWATAARFRNFTVTEYPGGTELYNDLPSVDNLGEWSIDDDELVQSSWGTDIKLMFGETTWDDYEYSLQAMKTSGSEGFLIKIRSDDDDADSYWLNLGGWNNTLFVLQKGESRTKVTSDLAGSINVGQWYDITIRCEGNRIRVWLDSDEIIDYTDTDSPYLTGKVGVGTWATTARFRNITVNEYPGGTELFSGLPSLDHLTVPEEWEGYGTATFSMNTSALNSDFCLQIDVVDSSEAGVEQTPFNITTQQYSGSLWACGTAPGGMIVRLLDGSTPLGEAILASPSATWTEYPFSITPSAAAEDATLQVGVIGPGTVYLDQVSMMGQDAINVDGYRPDLLQAIEDLGPPVIRWPGGCFASAYLWKDGIGGQYERVKYPMEIWDDQDVNSFGTDEFIQMCQAVGAEPLIVINTGLLSSACDVAIPRTMTPSEYLQDAMDWVEYCNGPSDSTWGAVRAANGHPEPYNVKYWEIDNEIWDVDAEDYNALVQEWVPALKSIDSTIKIIACGDYGYDTNRTQALIDSCADLIDYISTHYYADATAYQSVPVTYENHIVNVLSDYIRNSANPNIKIYLSEWNAQSTDWRTGLFAGGMLNVYERNSDILEMAGPALFLRHQSAASWDNAFINFDHTSWFPAPNYVVMKLWHDNYAPNQIALTGNVGDLNAIATKSADGDTIYFKVVNPTSQSIPVKLVIEENFVPGSTTLKLVAPGSLSARNTLSNPDTVKAVNADVNVTGQIILFTMPSLSAGVVKTERSPFLP